MAVKDKGGIETPYVDYIVTETPEAGQNQAVVDGEEMGPYKKRSGHGGPDVTTRERNMDGGRPVDLVPTQSPDAVLKRAG